MKRVHLLPNLLTAFGLTCGLFVIFRATMIGDAGADFETLKMLALVLGIAGVTDALDGAVARAVQGESDFGGVFDSLSDAVCFGVAPSVLVIKTLGVNPEAELSLLVMAGIMTYSLCGVLRLVRFSYSEGELKKRGTKKSDAAFTGLPIPAAAAAAVCMNLFLASPTFTDTVSLERDIHSWILSGVMFGLGYLMVSRWRFPSAKAIRLRVPSFQMVFVTVVFAVLFFFGLFYHFALVALVLSWSYILVSIVLSIARMIGVNEKDY
jgi:CDP-diacylglycerol--serine O-phosphatidyltransferase